MSKPPFPTECPCGAPWSHLIDEMASKTVGYWSDPGHDHDDNCTSMPVVCEGGHVEHVYIRRSCNDGIGEIDQPPIPPMCNWKGKTECCGDYAYVDEWPSLPVLA